MLCVEDYLDALSWAKEIGGLDALVGRADANAAVLDRFVENSGWLANLATVPETQIEHIGLSHHRRSGQ